MSQPENDMSVGHIDQHVKALEQFRSQNCFSVVQVSALITTAIRRGHKVIVFGNGGSAAQAQHFAAELIGQFLQRRLALPALALTTDTSVLTAIANDFGFEDVFVRQCEALARPGDVVLGISTSGRSRNVIAALKWCKTHGCATIALTGISGLIVGNASDQTIAIPGENVAITQELHLIWLHILCQLIEKSFQR